MLDWLKGTVWCPNHPEREAQVVCRVCKRQFCPDCVVPHGEFTLCRSDSCQGGFSIIKQDDERERRRRAKEDEREERELARKNPDQTLGDDLWWHGVLGLVFHPVRALIMLFFSEVDRRRKK